jgi:hypothetical protein
MEQYQQFDPFKFLISEDAGHPGAGEGMAAGRGWSSRWWSKIIKTGKVSRSIGVLVAQAGRWPGDGGLQQ